MALVKALVRYLGYGYHGLLALFLLAVAGMALSTDMHSLQLKMLPWTGTALTYWLLGGSIFGLLVVVLAVKGRLPALFFLWSLVVLGFMVKGYVFSGYYFSRGEISTPLYLMAGAVISVAGAWWGMKRESRRSKLG